MRKLCYDWEKSWLLYFVDGKFMADYWKELLDYLYDPTFVAVCKTYNYIDIKLKTMVSSMSVRNSHMIEVKRAVRRAILRDKFSNFGKK